MRLVSLYTDNLRAASGTHLPLSPLTALVGPNGSGKSTLLDALDLFFSGSDIPVRDLGRPTKPVTVTVTFDSSPITDGEFSITRAWMPTGEAAEGLNTTSRDLAAYEQEDVMSGVHVARIPATRTAAGDGTDTSKLGLTNMLREAIAGEAGHPRHTGELKRRQSYQNLHFSHRLDRLRSEVNKRLAGSTTSPGHAPDLEALFSFESPGIDPLLRVQFSEGRRAHDYASAGHGARRAYYMAAVEAHAKMSAGAGQTTLLLVDEPELYQHPQRQRRMLEAYRDFAKREFSQVVYTTHSPFLVDLRSLSGVHRVTRGPGREIRLAPCSAVDRGLIRLRLSRHMADGLFSDGTILVEGIQDVAILDAIFSVLTVDGISVEGWLSSRNIGMVHCEGVNDIPHFMRFFRALGVPTFVIWDADSNPAIHASNKRILDLLGARGFTWGEEPPRSGCDIGNGYACFASDCCVYFRERLGHSVPDSRLCSQDQGRTQKDKIKTRIKREMEQDHGVNRHFADPGFLSSDFATRVVPHTLRHFGHLWGARRQATP